MMMTDTHQPTRRVFCQSGAMILAGAATGLTTVTRARAAQAGAPVTARLGLMTDLHHADKPPAGSRFYREALAKLDEAVEYFNGATCDAVIELGDLIDSADSLDREIAHLKRIEQAYAQVTPPRHYVLGNHCVHNLRKQEFFEHTGARAGHHSFDVGDSHLVILDACFNSDMQPYERENFSWDDANIPGEELEWLEADLAQTSRKTIVLIHQRLDVTTAHGVKNAAAVRAILEKSGRVLAVFQGHNHINDLKDIAGIHYVTLAAMIEGSGMEHSAYCLLEVFDDGSLAIRGRRQQVSRDLPRA